MTNLTFGYHAVDSILQNAIDNLDRIIFDSCETDEASSEARQIAQRLWIVKEILHSAQNVLDLNKGE